jgi:TAG lipase/steryl ester hydrolase/phospholipase A2/LPA acyltransferase
VPFSSMNFENMSKLLNTPEDELEQAENYEQWQAAAINKDRALGADYWKQLDRSSLYDYKSIRSRLTRLGEKRASGDQRGLLFALNEGIHGNMGGMGKDALYKKATFGTKSLIEEYTTEITESLKYLASDSVNNISLEEKYNFFHRASHCFGRSALMLSGSGNLLYFHLGVVKALWEQDLLPKIICGSSGGALVGTLVGTHSHKELENIFQPDYIRFEVEQGKGILGRLGVLGSKPVSTSSVRNLYSRLIPEMTFEEAEALTGYQINVSVAPAEKHQSSRLLNSIASPNVLMREAIMASCAFPGFFPPVTLQAKDEYGNIRPYLKDRKWIDGSISDDMPIKRITRLYGANHFIVSQTNPAALPFIARNTTPGGFGIVGGAFKSSAREWLLAGNKLLGHSATSHSAVNKLTNMLGRVLSQTYTGDINILPPKRLHNPINLLTHRDTNQIMDLIIAGERSTWPHIERIRIQTQISRVLDGILDDLDHQVLHNNHKPGYRSPIKQG